jgi:CTP synthase
MLRLSVRDARLGAWEAVVEAVQHPEARVTIAIVGKYVTFKEAYKSLHEALVHGGIPNRLAVDLRYVDSGDIGRENCAALFAGVHGILVPGGFGARGIEGKIEAIRYARERRVPFFGICLGMQCAVVEFARNVAGIAGATSEECNPGAEDKVIYLMASWFDFRRQAVETRDTASAKGGTMRLGAYPCVLAPGTRAHDAYGRDQVQERHRHRYEFNDAYRQTLAEHGLVYSGLSPDGNLVEIVELPDHPWFLGCQFHPEFSSSPMRPHPLFRDFIQAAHRFATQG